MSRFISYSPSSRTKFLGALGKGISTLALLAGVALTSSPSHAQTYNYAEALQKAIYFYDCQRSGTMSQTNRVEWRGNSALGDGSDNGKDLTGGWYDAGDNVKFNFPMAGATTMLAWGVIENRQAYVNSGQLNSILDNLHWVCDYFIKCHTAPNEYYGQVGDGNLDHSWWGAAEVMQMARPSAKITTTAPGSDLAGETAAALAACSIVFQPTDPTYAATLLSHAQQLYTFADTYRGKYSDSIPGAQGFYTSFSGYNDELVWGAAWLYKATNNAAYLTKAQSYYANLPFQTGSTTLREYKWTHAWDDKSFGTFLLMAKITGATNESTSAYMQDTERWLNWWTVGGTEWGADNTKITYSPGGLAVLDVWASLRYAANTAFCALVYSDYLKSINGDATKIARYHNFALSQINYALGTNPGNHSYEVGFGVNPPSHEHHRSSHASWLDNIGNPIYQRHILYGALVGGPSSSDAWTDDRTNFQQNEVACDYNAGFTSALARLYSEYGGTPLAGFPAKETHDDDEEFVSASFNQTGTNFTEIKAILTNKSAWPARMGDKLSFRYFITLEPGVTPGMISLQSGYPDGATITGPILWSGNVYYINIDLTGQKVYPGGQSQSAREVQFRMTSSGAWDPNNDWSITGVAALGATPVKVLDIPVYDNGVKVFGNEPGAGSAPSAPTGLTATPGNAQVVLNWSAASGATSYNVSRSTVTGGPYTSVVTGLAGITYTNTGLTNGTTYYFVVSATNSVGTSPNSTQASATPVAPSPPAIPTGLTATSGNAQVVLNWSAASGATSYNVSRSTVTGGPYTSVATAILATTYTNTGLTNGTTYYFVVSATNAAGTSANSTQASATPVAPPPPPVPTGLTAAPGNAQVSLAWSASSGATSYNVSRSTVSGSGYASVATGITVTSYTNTGLTNGTAYYFVVSATNSAGTSANSAQASATPNVSIPAAPTGLAATGGNAQVALTWNASTGATSYSVYRGTAAGGESATAIITGLTTTSYTNTGLTNGTTYFFTVKAVNSAGTSGASNEASATPTAVTSSLKVQYKCNMVTTPSNQIQPDFEIFNTGTTSVALSTLKIRYYYTIDTTQPQTFYCDYAQVGSGNVSGAFAALSPIKTNADTYLEVGFNAAAGSIAANGNSGEVQVRFNKNDWSSFTQTNDYSFDPTKTAFADWNKVALYQNGTLVWGVTPP